MRGSPKLLTFEFVGLCLVAFLASCNVTVFYNLFNYLQSLGIATEYCGVVIGGYSLTAMFFYLVASPFVNNANAPGFMLLGIVVMIFCGLSYLFVHSFWGLLALRMVNGSGQFCLGAGTMAMFVSIIPPEKSGQAFGVYSVAILAAFGSVPAAMDAMARFIPSPSYGYAAATLSLLPAAWIVLLINRRRREYIASVLPKAHLPVWADIRSNISQLPIALLILLNLSYFANWSSLLFLFKGFALQRGIANVGLFFSAQTGVMIILRLLAGRLFDSIDKVRLASCSFITVAVGYFALDHLTGTWAVPLVGILFGLGMGAGYPAINGLMFQLSPVRFRSLNANLMLFAVQAGFFLGPVTGGAVVAHYGYRGYFRFSIMLALIATIVSAILANNQRPLANGNSTNLT